MADTDVPKFEVEVTTVDKRKELIKSRADSATKNNEVEPFYSYSRDLSLPVILVPVEVPLYRLNNARTKSWQISYSEEHEAIPDTFFKDSENVAAQKVQHKRLVELAKKGAGVEQPSIWNVLEDEGKQTEALLLTAGGIVLNGNRRLAAMREFSLKNSGFSQIRAAILPDWLREPDLLEIEARLQVAPDVRLQYDWTDEALLILSMREAGIKDERIAKILRKKDSELDLLLERFNEGKLFLAEAMKEPTNLNAIVQHEQNFTELTKALKKASTDEKEVSRAIFNAITIHQKDATRRIYDYRIMYGQQRKTVLQEFARRKKIAVGSGGPPPAPTTGEDDDLFDDDVAATPNAAPLTQEFAAVIEALKDGKEGAANATLLREIGDELIELKDDTKVRALALRKIERAQLLLEQVFLDKADPNTFADMKTRFDAIEVAVQKLRAEIGRVEKHA